jgi:hypothetical protein
VFVVWRDAVAAVTVEAAITCSAATTTASGTELSRGASRKWAINGGTSTSRSNMRRRWAFHVTTSRSSVENPFIITNAQVAQHFRAEVDRVFAQLAQDFQ